jgi:hypothetical protein
VARRPPARLGPTERALLERYVDALRRHDVTAVVALARADAAAQPVGSSLVVDEAVAERVCDGP